MSRRRSFDTRKLDRHATKHATRAPAYDREASDWFLNRVVKRLALVYLLDAVGNARPLLLSHLFLPFNGFYRVGRH
jgi:hypothetical protein